MNPSPSEAAIRRRMVELVAEALGVAPEAVDVDAELSSLGLDSIRAFALTGDLAEWLDRELSATLLWEHPSIRALAASLSLEGSPGEATE